MKRLSDNDYRTFIENQVRLINVFTFNSQNIKNSSRIREPHKLYKISAELEQLEKSRAETKFARMKAEDLERLKSNILELMKSRKN